MVPMGRRPGTNTDINNPTKKCPKCKEIKSLNDYHYSSHTYNGRQVYCKVCTNAADKIKRENYKKNGPTIIRNNKICSMCDVDKEIGDFPKSKSMPDGHINYCKPCWVKYVTARKKKS